MYPSILSLVMPEIFITIMACPILLIDVFSNLFSKRLSYYLSLITLFIAALITIKIIPDISQTVFSNAFILDKFACVLKLSLYALLATIFICSKVYISERNFLHGEFFSLSLFSLLGMMLLISSGNFLTMYLGLELLVLPLYAMIVMAKNKVQYAEAAMKYFIIGSLGAGMLLYGISLIYGATGSFEFSGISVTPNSSFTLQLGMIFVIASLALEFGAVPFHMWLPDVYEGSPTAVTMIIRTIPKIAVFAMAYRLLTLAFANLNPQWQQLFMIVAVLSLGLGNVAAIAQTNIKRMLAYSTIGHIGFILLGLLAAAQEGYLAVLFYTLTYTLMALAAFAMIMRLSKLGFEAEELQDFRGLNKKNPGLAFIMLLVMLSLAGLPPLVGFYAKFLVLQTVIAAGFTSLALIALLFSVIGTFYYLRLVVIMYFTPADGDFVVNNMSLAGRTLLMADGMLLLLVGIFPGLAMFICLFALR